MLSKSTRAGVTQIKLQSSQWRWGYGSANHRPRPRSNQTRSAHAVAVNTATDFFTSTIPGTSQRTKPVGFDEEPCTLSLTDGYGYAKVDIGDRVGSEGEYEVLRKLGWGMYATTWLAYNHSTKKYHALKIVNEYGTYLETNEPIGRQHPRFHEREILERISSPSKPNSRGPKHCLQLANSFYIYRGNAQYLCLVLELGGMDLSSLRGQIGLDYALDPMLVKSIVKQILWALDYIHTECKVVHTDLKPANILIGLNPREGKKLVRTALEETPVQRYPPRRIMGETVEGIKSQPLPLVKVESLHEHDMLSWKFKLGDFGSAQWLGRRSTSLVQPIRLRAPEVVLGRDWDEKIDVWSLGCLTYEFLTGRSLFRAKGGPTWSDEDDLLASQLEILSTNHQFPDYFVQNPRHTPSPYLSQDGSLRNIPDRVLYPKSLAKALSKYTNAPINHLTNEDQDSALSFIARCLTLNPKHRPSAKELLRHPWIRGFKAPRTPGKTLTEKGEKNARKESKSSERSLGVSDRVDKGDTSYIRKFSS